MEGTALTATTPFGSAWQRTDPSSPVTRIAAPGGQTPVTRACLDSSIWALRTISPENISSDDVTSSAIRSSASLPEVISFASTGRGGATTASTGFSIGSSDRKTAKYVAPAAASAPTSRKAMRRPADTLRFYHAGPPQFDQFGDTSGGHFTGTATRRCPPE